MEFLGSDLDGETAKELREFLKEFGCRFTIQSYTKAAIRAADWIKSPMLMLEDLTLALQTILKMCEADVTDGAIRIQLRPEYIGETVIPKGLVGTLKSVFDFQTRPLHVVNAIQLTPFRSETAHRLWRMLNHGTSLEFDQSIEEFKFDLQNLSDWINAKQLLTEKVPPSKVATVQKPRTAEIDDVKRAFIELQQQGEKPTKARITKLIRKWGMTIGGTRAQTMKRQVEKQSAVRPPNCAD